MRVPAGQYKAVLNPTSKTKMNLELKIEDKEYKFPLSIPEGVKVPESDGQLDLTADEIGQPYDLDARVKTDISSYDYDRHESCVSGYVSERRCHWVPSRESCHETGGEEVCTTRRTGERVCATTPTRTVCRTIPGHESCRVESIPVYGSQRVSYRDTRSTRHVAVELADAGSIVASFAHADTDTSTSRMGSSVCR
jgi:hypothetical protein